MFPKHQFYLCQWGFLAQSNISIRTREKKKKQKHWLCPASEYWHVRILSRRHCSLVSCSTTWWCICCWAFAVMLRFHFRPNRNDEVNGILLPKTVELSFFKWKRHSSNLVTQGIRPSCIPTHCSFVKLISELKATRSDTTKNLSPRQEI